MVKAQSPAPKQQPQQQQQPSPAGPRKLSAAEVSVIESRIKARQMATEIIAIAEQESLALANDEARRAYWETIWGEAGAHISPEKKKVTAEDCFKPIEKFHEDRHAAVQGDESDEAISLIEDALSMVDELPDAGIEYGESVAEKLRSIAETIEEAGRVTPRQLQAIENMKGGLERWLR